MEPTTLQATWFFLIGLLFTGYTVLDGFDFGVGILHLFARGDRERRLHLNAIAPVWEGNQVWLLTGGGALFAAFPVVYANVFSGFYLALMALLLALIFRGVSMKFRSKVESPAWRRTWDYGFGLGSFVAALLFGVAFGNILLGLPLDEDFRYTGNFLTLLNPYALVVGLLGVALFTMHGAVYLANKVEGDLKARLAKWASGGWMASVVLFIAITGLTFGLADHLLDGTLRRWPFWVFLVMTLGSTVYAPVALKAERLGRTFLATSGMIAGMLGIAATSLYPFLVPAREVMAHGMTAVNSANSERTLTVMLVIACIGMPLVLLYTAYLYRVFRGPVSLGENAY